MNNHLIRVLGLVLMLIICTNGFGQSEAHQPTIMVIPFAKEGESVRKVYEDSDPKVRIAVTKVKEGFDNEGFATVDFIGKMKTAIDGHFFTNNTQSNETSLFLESSGCDVYVTVEISLQTSGDLTSATVTLNAYEVSTGNSLASKVGSSPPFQTQDVGRLTTKAVEKCISDFTQAITKKYKQMELVGQSVLVDFSFDQNSSYTLKTEIGSSKILLEDLLPAWFERNSKSFHTTGTGGIRMIFDDVKIPLTLPDGSIFTSGKYATNICTYLRAMGIPSTKQVRSNSIYITIN